MEFENKNSSDSRPESSKSNIDLREIAEKYLGYWKWFLLSIIISVLISFYFLNFERNVYEANAVIKIKNEQGGDGSALSAFQDLGVIASTNQNVEDEMEILLSKDLISEVIKSLNLNVQFFTKKNRISDFLDTNLNMDTHFYEIEEYSNPPLKIDFFLNDSILSLTKASFIVTINSLNKYTYTELDSLTQKKHAFGEKVKTNFGDVVITPNINIDFEQFVGSRIMVRISPVRDLAITYAERIKIEPKSDFSSILNLTISDGRKEKAEDFLNELVAKYNDRAIRSKEAITKSTSDFVNRRLAIISNDLSDVDRTAETLKTRYAAVSDAGLNMQTGQALENQIVQANMQLEQINSVKDFVISKDKNELIPVDVGISDNSVSSSIEQYNQLMLRKRRFLENSTDKNPIVVNLNEQLSSLKRSINVGLNNLESSQKISIDALNKQDARINSRLYSAPRQDRLIRDVQRQQGIKESLYLYLLQKREETAITLGVADPNAKIIDSPESRRTAVSPKKARTYFGFIIFGLFLTAAIIYLFELFDSKIHSREEVEKALNIPIIGDIPKLESKTSYLIKKTDHSSVAEAFRIIRTNLNYLLTNSESKGGKSIFITSTIAHEGKSLIASNLAAALSHTGKRTLLIGMDIRAPKIKDYLGIRGKVGVTSFIVDPNLDIQSIIVDVPNTDNLSIISSGDLAPNPAELLMHPRVNELFEFAKENYDYVIVDTAAFSMVTDTLLISQYADAFIYVVRTNFLDKRALKYISSLFKENRLPNMSLLINGIDAKSLTDMVMVTDTALDLMNPRRKKGDSFNYWL